MTLESCSDPPPIIYKGTVADNNGDAGQLDLILCRPYCRPRHLGTQCLVSKDDTLCVIEVKGNCTGRDLKKANQKAATISNLDGNTAPLYGVICCQVELQKKTILQRFRLTYDTATNTYYDNACDPNEDKALWKNIEYPDLDFFISLEDGNKIFLRKYELMPGIFRFIRYTEDPLIKPVFIMMNTLWKEANQPVTRAA